MIVHSKEVESQKSLIDLLGGKTRTSTKSNDLFSKLLTTFKMSSEDQPLGGDDKESTLVSKELLATLSDDQVRALIHKAKEFLKNEITQKAPEYQSDLTKLPKSLIGLAQLAQKLGLEPESISLSTLSTEPKEKSPLPIEFLSQPLFESKMLAMFPIRESSSTKTTPFEAITQLLGEVKSKEQKILSSNQIPKEETEKTESQPLKTLLQTLENRLENGDLMKSSQTPKAIDSIEVKAKEAQQSMRHFAGELKEALQEYKPPFTRLAMKLNPEKLGEVEVTLVQRGNNVHVNIQSNNTTTVAFLAHNATELKAQLAHHGITNTTMNFMSGGENQQQNNAHQQQQDHQHNRYKAYRSFEELELNEEQLSALEIIIPHYA